MRDVTVNKDELVNKLVKNKLIHQNDFDIAWEKYRDRAMQNVERILKKLKSSPHGKNVELWVGLEPPENHVRDYDRALEMCAWEVGDTVSLTEQEFKQFVQDEWTWKSKFTASNKLYSGSESPSTMGSLNSK